LPIGALTWAMILVTAAACVYPSAVLFWSMTHFKQKSPACVENLRDIEIAKSNWAIAEKKSTNAAPTWEDVRPWLNNSEPPVCPDKGVYTIGKIGETPTCSIGGPGHTNHFKPGFPWDLLTVGVLILSSAVLQVAESRRKRQLTSPLLSPLHG